jgi:gas vesicle protein
MYDRDDSAPSLLSFLIGGIIGASLACLLAPSSGAALRRRIGARAAGEARRGRAAANRLANAGRALAAEASEVLTGPDEDTDPGLPAGPGGGGRG